MNDIVRHLEKFLFFQGCGSLSFRKDFSITEMADGVLTCDHTHIVQQYIITIAHRLINNNALTCMYNVDMQYKFLRIQDMLIFCLKMKRTDHEQNLTCGHTSKAMKRIFLIKSILQL